MKHSDENLRNLLLETLQRVDAPGQGPVTRRVTITVLHDLGRNIANAYRWNDLLLAVRHDGNVDSSTESAIRACIRAINGPVLRRMMSAQLAWNREMPAMAM